MLIPEVDLDVILRHFTQMGIAYLLALPIAFNREKMNYGVGLRTFPLVAIASCGFMLVGMEVYSGSDAEARVMYGIITGMGFIGGGAIVKSSGKVGGTSTAAGIWCTGAIGVSVAYHRYEIAIVLSIITYITFRFTTQLKNGNGNPIEED